MPMPVISPVVLRAKATPTAPELVLRPWSDADAAALVEVFEDPVLRHWTNVPAPDEAGTGVQDWLETQRHGWATGERFAFAVLEADDALVGHVVLKDGAEVGYWTATRARGRGVAPRALDTLTAWAFTAFSGTAVSGTGLTSLRLVHQSDNHASCRVAEKTGYALHDILRAAPPAFPRDGHLHVRRA
ncbi:MULTISPECIES: GNAT family N-acetyltransferase [Streptomyces]|uniref:GNAT family N-acetyltransferase n=2 Tax=Streptomyces TaxID=1883 RepID=A0ABV9INQ6_9ACTN